MRFRQTENYIRLLFFLSHQQQSFSFAIILSHSHSSLIVSGVKALAVEIDIALPNSSQRNDADIARSAENVLEWIRYIPREHIKVMVENGFVTLTGQVDWDYQKRTAVNAIRSLFGVTGVSTPQNGDFSIKFHQRLISQFFKDNIME